MSKTTQSMPGAQQCLPILWWSALLASSVPVVFRQVSVSDAWWHIAIGKWLVQNRSLPDLTRFYFGPTDSASLYSELRWQWLGDVGLYGLYATFGSVGLQLLAIACFVVAVFFLRRFAVDPLGSWLLVLMVAVCFGTYQLQLPRNSVFSLALYPLVLWLGSRGAAPPSLREYGYMASVLMVWSCLHGSCLLGWVTLGLLLLPRVMGAFTARDLAKDATIFRAIDWPNGLRSLAVFALAMAMFLFLISWGRADAVHLLQLPLRHIERTAQVVPVAVENPPAPPADGELLIRGIKEWFNSSIWKKDPATPWSNDYWSPFDMLPGNKPVEATIALCLLAALCAVFLRNVPAGLLLAWAGAVFLGLGYVRMFGYAAIASAAVVATSLSSTRFSWHPWVRRAGWVVVVSWLATAWWLALSSRIQSFIPEGQHVFAVGQVPVYDDAVVDWVKSKFPDEKVFTTIETGSYCLLRWNFEKPVFLDGFFAPHTREVWSAYRAAREKGDFSGLEENLGITVALVPSTSFRWIERFRLARDWRPVAVGGGMVVFARATLRQQAFDHPKIFAEADNLRRSSFYYRYHALAALFRLAAADPGPEVGFAPSQWTSLPEFEPLRLMAAEVFPSIEIPPGAESEHGIR